MIVSEPWPRMFVYHKMQNDTLSFLFSYSVFRKKEMKEQCLANAGVVMLDHLSETICSGKTYFVENRCMAETV